MHRTRRLIRSYTVCHSFRSLKYSKTSLTPTPMTRLPWLIRSRFWVPRKLYYLHEVSELFSRQNLKKYFKMSSAEFLSACKVAMYFAVSRKPLNQVTSVYDKFSNQLKTITSVIMRDFFFWFFFFVQSNCRLLLLLMVSTTVDLCCSWCAVLLAWKSCPACAHNRNFHHLKWQSGRHQARLHGRSDFHSWIHVQDFAAILRRRQAFADWKLPPSH